LLQINFILNGQPVTVECSGSETLLSVLRDHLGLSGVKEGCGVGECGACTVLLDDRAVNACLVAVGKVQGRQVTTIEGLAVEDRLHPLQQGFLEMGAVQCGFCTPGMILAAYSLLKENPHPNRREIVEALSGNLCRCTGYHDILRAVKWASKRLQAAT
jgi:aerobic-type carbon monoxide dehydrogenase small subunit (CoxS/CutS family)